MEVVAFLADSVQAAGGKLHALGVGWRVLHAQALPTRHDRVGIGVMVRTSASEAGAHRLMLTLNGPEGRTRPFGADADGMPRTGLELPFSSPEGEANVTLALNLDGLVFEQEGRYEFVLTVDGSEHARLPFNLQTKPEPEPIQYGTGVYL
jgi:hypothetical protein